jgi:CubicO group peptidase (beta-lactamase class C family)
LDKAWEYAGVLQVEIDPQEAGFDPARLNRIDRHYQRYVDEGKLPGFLAVIARDGRLVHVAKGGLRDVEARTPVEGDTLFRIYSMTKPITSVAAMMLWEEGAFELKDPVSRFIPAFADARVWTGGSQTTPETAAAREPVRMWHLLTHTSGLAYGFAWAHPVDGLYRDHGFEFGSPAGMDLAGCVDVWAGLPLLFEPGTEFNYSVATDVLGRVIEVLCGRPLDVVFKERIFEPLGMPDTGFGNADPQRLAALYGPGLIRNDRLGAPALGNPRFLSGGGGLIGTAADYHRFTQMLLGGGELDGARLLGTRTLRYMGRNHLPGGAELKAVARPTISETQNEGMGFGLGFSVVLDPARTKVACSEGELAWGGLASTAFWVDRQERITAHFFTQLVPSSTYPLRSQLRQLTYQALVD